MAVNKNIGNYFGATPDRPYHLSVGAVVLDKSNKVICLHYPNIDEIENVYVLLNKTVKPRETLEDTLSRGARLELGYELELITFLGTQLTADNWWGELGTPITIEKSVMYFLAKVTSEMSASAKDENQKEHRKVVTIDFNSLLSKMKTTRVKDGMRDFNQTAILIRAKEWLRTHPDMKSDTL